MVRSGVALLATALSALFPASAATLAITPANPHSLDTVRVQVPSAGTFVYALDRTRITLTGATGGVNNIQVAMAFDGAVSPIPPPYTTDVMLGDLPEGAYHVDVVVQGPGPQPLMTLGSADFTVVAPAGDRTRSNLTDLWWNPNESGWGVNVVDHASGKLFVTWFTYGADSRPTWLVAPDVSCTGPSVCLGDVYRTSGPAFGDAFDAASVQRTKVGTMWLQYTTGVLVTNQPPEGFEIYFSLDADPANAVRRILFRQPF